ncbi:hypothetical protein HNY73_018376 [Argiope bruennichi]|uniref:Uncharacterized protein n=1 Tax=Argiope bruennichi TaxID=94029 RepID=A0A8T0EDP2_ARGBR|nr:hypothetical protein HNY73_018376 [Argiope bruennichi]
MYCLVDSIKTLWAVLDAIGVGQFYARSCHVKYANAMVPFWIRWLREGARCHWAQAALEYLDFKEYREHPKTIGPSISAVFRALTPHDRRKFFEDLVICNTVDFRFCLYAVTNEEQEEIMKLHAPSVLECHMNWPLTNLFLEVAEKLWKFLSHRSFVELLYFILDHHERTDIDCKYLAAEFWKMSPEPFKEYAKTSLSFKINVMGFIKEKLKKKTGY